MWNKRRDEEPPRSYSPVPSKPVSTTPEPVEVKKEANAVSSMPARVEPDVNRGSSAIIGKAVKIVGQIYSKEDLFVDGEVEGTIEALEHKLTIGPNGGVNAGVKAREVVALGRIHGNVEATDKIEIRKDAKLVGDIRTARIIIEDGAYFKGSIDIVKPEPVRAAAKPQPVAVSAAPPPAAAGEAKR